MRNIEYLVLHTTGNSNLNLRAEAIQDYFLRPKEQGGKGWTRGGYHVIIESDGDDFRFYADSDITNGVKPYKKISNSNIINIATIGGLTRTAKPTDNRTKAQIEKQTFLIRQYVAKYPNIKILGHNQINNKPCPCYSVPKFCESIGIAKRNILFDDFLRVLKFNNY